MHRTTNYANNIFEQPWWLDIVAPGQWREIFVRDDKENVIARQAIVTNKNNVLMPRLTPTLGIWMIDNVLDDYGAQKKIIKTLSEEIQDYKNVLIRLSPENKYILPYRWNGYIMEPKFTYRIKDLHDLDKIYKGFHKTAKKNIKSAKNKVSISENLDIDELWEMLNKTFEVQNRKNPMSKELVYRIVRCCESNGHGKYFSAKDSEGHVHSCGYFVYDEKACYYLLGATDAQYRSSGAQSFVIWEAIQFAAKHSQVFDFEGSMVEGIENFFRQFGGECTAIYEIRRQSLYKEIFLLLKPKIKRLIGYKV